MEPPRAVERILGYVNAREGRRGGQRPEELGGLDVEYREYVKEIGGLGIVVLSWKLVLRQSTAMQTNNKICVEW